MNKISAIIITGITAVALFLYFSGGTDTSEKPADTAAQQSGVVTQDETDQADTAQTITPEDPLSIRSTTQDVAPGTPENLTSTTPEELVEARLLGITFLQRRALRGDQSALETLRRLIKTGDANFRLEAVELMSRSTDSRTQSEVMVLLEKPSLSDDDVDAALLMIIGTFEDIEAALALEDPIDPSTIRRRGE